MATKIEHIGIVVRDLDDSLKKFTSLLGLKVKEVEEVNVEGNSVKVEFVWGKIINGSRGTKVAVIEKKELNGVYIELVQKHQ